ncbi:MAG: hypothetical protein K2K21_16590, partial [Lachnospiraceae bacterium]|nr:hypothetical protein [Lachnospiraceae bacterium]
NQFNQMNINEISISFLNDYFDSKREFSEDEIIRILDGGLLSGEITQKEYNYLKASFSEMFELKGNLIIYETLRILEETLLSANFFQGKHNNILYTNMVDSLKEILKDEKEIQNLYNEIEINIKEEYNRIVAKQRTMVTLCDPLVAYRGYPQVETFDHTIQLGDVNNPYDPVYTNDAQGNQQANCYRVDMREREEDIEHPDWYAFMYRDLDKMAGYYSGTEILECERSEDGLIVTSEDQTFFFHLENGWWMDENGRYLITVGPNVLLTEYGKDGDYDLNFDKFAGCFGCRIDVILVNDTNPDDILTLECIYGGDIKAHTEGSDNGVYMTGRSWLDINDTATADGSIVEFIGMPNDDNGIMSEYHVELIIVYDNAAEEVN